MRCGKGWEIEGPFSPGYGLYFALDTTLAVHAGIEEVIHTLLEAVVLSCLVVFLFYKIWRATLIPLFDRSRIADRHFHSYFRYWDSLSATTSRCWD